MDIIRAFPITLIRSPEPLRATQDVAATAASLDIPTLVWDINAGARPFAEWEIPHNGQSARLTAQPDPLTALRALNEAPAPAALIALGFHHFLRNPQILQALMDGARAWAATARRFVIIAPPATVPPPDIERYVFIADHALPTPDELAAVARNTAALNDLDLDNDTALRCGRAGRGLTRYEFSMCLALSMTRHGALSTDTILAQKRQLVSRNAVLDFANAPFTFADIGGLEQAKRFLRATATHPLARGALFLGVPGVGKTMLAKALGRELDLPCVQLQFSRVFSSLVGESEARLRAALAVIDSLGECVVIIDEIEKGLAGVASSHKSDAGAAARVGEAFLTWLNDHPAGPYVVATCNDIDKLPPEFVRAERWDAVFFFDTPSPAERDAIARLCSDKYGVPLHPRPDHPGWTGAEISTAYRLAAMMHTSAAEAGRYVVPLVRTMAEQIDALREWARGRCVPASDPDTTPPHTRRQSPASRSSTRIISMEA